MPPTPEDPAPADAPVDAVAPLARGLLLTRLLTDAGGTLSPSELQRASGLARSTVDRVVATLERMGYLRVDRREVTLAPRLLELGNAYLAALGVPDRLGPRARRLALELDESVSLAVGDGDGVRFVQHATRRRAVSLTFGIGDLLPAERTAAGQLVATGWTEADWARWRERRAADPDDNGFPAVGPRQGPAPDFPALVALAAERGWAVDDQLVERGLVALAVPVRSPDGRVACVASVSSHTSRHTAESLREQLLPCLRDAIAAMEHDLRAEGPTGADRAGSGVGLAAWTGASKQELGREFIESLARGLTVLTAFDAGRAELGLSAVATATGLARATARRALITLVHLGYVSTDGRLFRPTPRVLGLGFPVLAATTLARIATPHLEELAVQVRDSSSLAVAAEDDGDIQYVARAATRRIMDIDITLGTRFPAYATGMGRVLLASLPPAELRRRLERTEQRPLTPHTITSRAGLVDALDRVRADGYAMVDEELEIGVRSVAVPVRDRAGAVVAAVNVAMHSERRTPRECVDEVLPLLRAAATAIEADLHVTERFATVPKV
ncbi:IclR family transcriptional regulator domain-containing protein [Actinokineospora globicatena]|uniref:IclR family transcriptional regulator domain-containing protein n=1 Tax=Actinokineospora globicatena TaxID=103729 RepID=UPI0027E2A86B|nr:IclR family transcriptional regulator C-terminal domain-containing protein [Actinokineospora globicatena]MCP2303993.1 transcriptional regulator, IclR family [Actinokineospora globicatena]GLW78844.1 transcriptional regulator [Actinokineospora globicatena]GLW86743.1 transcriptional regulator [Actinokineospora globicatena]